MDNKQTANECIGGAQPVEGPSSLGDVLSFSWSAVWRARWWILAAAAAISIATFALLRPPQASIWTAAATIRIGQMPKFSYLLEGTGDPVEPIEDARVLVSRLSNPSFRSGVRGNVTFGPETRTDSETLLGSSLRGVVLANEREVLVEVSSASQADANAAMEAVVSAARRIHDGIADRRMALLRLSRSEYESRVELLRQVEAGAKADRGQPAPDAARVVVEGEGGPIRTINRIKDAERRLLLLENAVEPTSLADGTGVDIVGPRSADRLRAPLLAGLAALLVSIVLTLALAAPSHGGRRRTIMR